MCEALPLRETALHAQKTHSFSWTTCALSTAKGMNFVMYYSTMYDAPVGRLLLTSDGDALSGVWIDGQKYFGGTPAAETTPDDDLRVFTDVKNWFDRYFAGERPAISELKLQPAGGEFRQAVWALLCEIPYGTVTTYGDIARKVAAKLNRTGMSSQAVGGAVGHNPISIIIPCHRVVGASGSLTGYAAGIDTKIQLLTLEGIDLSKLSRPKREVGHS